MNEEVVTGGVEEFVDETLVCKECGNEFVFTAGEQKFYQEKALLTSPRAAKLVVTQRKTQEELRVNTLRQLVQIAAV